MFLSRRQAMSFYLQLMLKYSLFHSYGFVKNSKEGAHGGAFVCYLLKYSNTIVLCYLLHFDMAFVLDLAENKCPASVSWVIERNMPVWSILSYLQY